MAETTAWLVEAPGNHSCPASWWYLRGWTTAMDRALRFSRKVDAETYIKSEGFRDVIARRSAND